jgi:GTP-sensing pleiotropic transcriptional regulator CodY
MKLGVKEFRHRLTEVLHGSEAVDITHHGRVIGTFRPRKINLDRARQALESNRRWQEEMRAKGIDLEGVLADMGLDPWGEPLNDSSDR